MNKRLVILVGPPGSGKSTYSKQMNHILDGVPTYTRISQDDMGREMHFQHFLEAKNNGENIIIDRMNFDKKQRERYIKPAKEAGYEIKIVIFHVPRQTCFERMMERESHPTINGNFPADGLGILEDRIGDKNWKAHQANSALDTFFTKYERVEDSEADIVLRLGWDANRHSAIICDLDGTLCNIEHRLKHVKHEIRKHNRWDLFNKEIPNDGLNKWCKEIISKFYGEFHDVILCSGRVDSTRDDTVLWLEKHYINYDKLLMRHRSDFRQDYIIKEIILDFEILPRYKILFAIDDRKQVVDMWRRRGLVCLQCEEGNF